MNGRTIINKINRFLKLEKAAVLIATIGSITWIFSFFFFFYFIVGDQVWFSFKPNVDTSPWDAIVTCFLTVWVPMPFSSCVGILSGCRYIWRQGFSGIAAVGIFLNIIWFAMFVTYGILFFTASA